MTTSTFPNQIENSYSNGKGAITVSKASNFHTNLPPLAWLEALEANFDRNFVDLDLLISGREIDSTDQSEMILGCRLRLTTISGIFVQLLHRTQTYYQRASNAEVIDLIFCNQSAHIALIMSL